MLSDLLEHPRSRQLGRAAAIGVVTYTALQVLWPAPLGVVVYGLIVGGLTALVAFGIALVYKANRIINFAQADLGGVPATLGVMLIVARHWPYPIALAAVIVSALLFGALVQWLMIRRFFRAPRLILTVVTIGVAQVLTALSTVLPSLFTHDFKVTRTYAPPIHLDFSIGPIVFHGNDVIAIAAVPFVIAALVAFLRLTSIGQAIRASADNADRAALLGIPVARVQTVVWAAAALLSGVGMFLRAGVVGLPLGTPLGPGLLLRALAAAVIGRMESFTAIFVASLGVGVVEQAIVWHTGNAQLVDAVLFVIVLGALLVQRRRSAARFDDGEASSWQAAGEVRPVPSELASLPEIRWARIGGIGLFLVVAIALPSLLDAGRTNLAALVWIFGILAVSLVVLTGWAGQVSLGQMGFMGVGAGTGAAMTTHWAWADPVLVLVLAGLVGAVAALIIGLPALRIRGLFLAVTTLGFALATTSYLLNHDYMSWLPLPSSPIPRRDLFGRFSLESERAYYYFCLAAFGVAVWMVQGLRRSRTGRVLVGVRDNERAAQSFGVNVTRAKLTAFAISGFLAAVAGALYVHHQQTLTSAPFEPAQSLRAFTMVVIGGPASLLGAVLGSLYLNGLDWCRGMVPERFRLAYSLLGTGAGLVLFLMVLPGGIASVCYRVRDAYLRRVASRRDIEVPSLVADSDELDDSTPDRVESTVDDGALLRVRSTDVSYGPVQVLFDVSLGVREGEIVALLGTNGAGKSTILRAISGLLRPSAGTIELDGQDITKLPPHRIVELGVGHVPGGRGVFPSLTVAENLRVASWMHRRDADRTREAIDEVLTLFPALRDHLHRQAGNLSGGQQQMLTLAQTFITKPRLVMIDELSLGLAPTVVEQLIEAVRTMRDRGTTLVLVEQSVNVALTVADRAYFMEKGEVRFDGPTAQLLDRPEILRSVYVQGAAANGSVPATPAKGRRRAPASANPALVVDGLTRSFGGVRAVSDVSLTLHEGEILGIIGPNGAGKTTLFDLISAFMPADEGRVLLGPLDLTPLGPDVRSRLGLGRSFQDARLFPSLRVKDTIALAFERSIAVRDPLAAVLSLPAVADSESVVAARVEELIDLLGLGSFRDKFLGELSTGSRRIVELACVLAHRPSVLLLDEPSSGIAQRETEALGPLLRRIQAETGAAMLVIEHDMPLITDVADELLALDLGKVIVRDKARKVLEHPHVVSSYLGSSADVVARSGGTRKRRSAPPTRRRPLVAAGDGSSR